MCEGNLCHNRFCTYLCRVYMLSYTYFVLTPLQSARVPDTGPYTCYAENKLGRIEAMSAVTIRCKLLTPSNIFRQWSTGGNTRSPPLGCDISRYHRISVHQQKLISITQHARIPIYNEANSPTSSSQWHTL